MQSRTVTIGFLPLLKRCWTTSLTIKVHCCVVLVTALKPNCKLSLEWRCFQRSLSTFSKIFRIRKEPAMGQNELGFAASSRDDLSSGKKLQK